MARPILQVAVIRKVKRSLGNRKIMPSPGIRLASSVRVIVHVVNRQISFSVPNVALNLGSCAYVFATELIVADTKLTVYVILFKT